MKKATAITLVSLVVATVAQAHEGPRIWIGNIDGNITTYRSDYDLSPTIFTPCRLFQAQFQKFSTIYTTEFPGFEVIRTGGNIVSGTTFRFDIAGPALYFDALTETFVTTNDAFGPPEPGPIPQIALSLGASVRTTNDSPVAGFDFFTYFATGDHSHLSFTLFGNGVSASDGPDGVYAISMTLSSTTMTTSAPFYLLIGKNVPVDDPVFDEAVAIARSSLIGVDQPGDMDCDGSVGIDDLDEFVDAVLSGTVGLDLADCCHVTTADMNGDEFVDGRDVQLFVTAIVNG